jgi:hypothetical protein
MSNLKRKFLESKASLIQKKIVRYLEPKSLLELEKELNYLLQTERALVKLSRQMNVSVDQLQMVIDDFLELLRLMQL